LVAEVRLDYTLIAQAKKYGKLIYLNKAFEQTAFEKGQTFYVTTQEQAMFFAGKNAKKTGVLNWERKKNINKQKGLIHNR